MLLIVAGIVPGAVVGGRARPRPRLLVVLRRRAGEAVRPERRLAVAAGRGDRWPDDASYVARLIDAPVRRWADAAAVPLLLALGLGKLAQLLGGSGQGLPFDGSWAVAFTGAGPWVSTNPRCRRTRRRSTRGCGCSSASRSCCSSPAAPPAVARQPLGRVGRSDGARGRAIRRRAGLVPAGPAAGRLHLARRADRRRPERRADARAHLDDARPARLRRAALQG